MHQRDLENRRLLVVEDEYLVAFDLMSILERAGARVYGPVSDVERAVEIVEGSEFAIDVAILDINLHGEMVYHVAELLSSRHIPYVFVTGYECSSMPKAFAKAPCLTKPIDERTLIGLLATLPKRNELQ